MGPRFRELPIDEFLKRVPGDAPSVETRKQFKEVDCSKVMLEKDWYPLMNATANSVFEASESAKVEFMDTATHKAAEPAGTDAKKKRTATFNDAGVYLNSPAAQKATTLSEKQRKNSKIDEKEMKARGKVGARSWHWVAIPVEIKHANGKTAFVFNEDPKPGAHPPSERSQPSGPKLSRVDAPRPTNALTSSDVYEDLPPSAAPMSDGDAPDVDAGKPKIKPFIPNSNDGETALVQFAEYMLNVVNHQHRVRCFAIYVWRYKARLCCFDRNAAIVSEQFSWITTDSPLHDFFWRVAHMSLEELGYDPTATVVDDDEEAKPFKDMAKDERVPEPVQKYVAAATAEGVPIYKIRIKPMAAPADEGLPIDPSAKLDESSRADASLSTPDPSSSPPPVEPEERCFLVGKPHFVTDSLVGRCTRGYVAYDVSNERLCFVKDYWRPYVSGRTRPEHLIYERLKSYGVSNISTLICGGDVGGVRAQMTELQDLLVHLQNPPVPRVHFRLATEEIGLPLEDFEDFTQLVYVFYYAILAHFDAWTKAKVLHRDISVGNILIDPITKKGILIDWDLSRLEWELASGPTEPDRTGTWLFRSALALAYPRKPPRLSDDLEGFIHVFRYLVLKYHPTDTTSLKNFVTSTFEVASVICGVKVGGETKLSQFRARENLFNVRDNPVLQAVLDAFHEGCHKSYMQINRRRMRDLYGIRDPTMDETPDTWETQEARYARPDIEAARKHFGADIKSGEKIPNDSDHGDGEKVGAGTEAAESDAHTTCALSGFLSHHRYLIEVLLSIDPFANPLKDKKQDQFHVRRVQDDLLIVPRTSTRGIGGMSVSTSNATTSSFTDSAVAGGKRARLERETVDNGDAQGASTSGEYDPDEGEDVTQAATGEQDRKKRQKMDF